MKKKTFTVQTESFGEWTDDLEFEHELGYLNRIEVLLSKGIGIEHIRVIISFNYVNI